MPLKIGQRVWVKSADSPWWPAKVILPEVLGMDLPPGADTAVEYYMVDGEASYDTLDSSDPTRVRPFETESDLAKVPEIQGALRMALEDDMALRDGAHKSSVDVQHAPPAGFSGSYEVGHKVWIRSRQSPNGWWPAKIVSLLSPPRNGADAEVALYPTSSGKREFVDSTNAEQVVPYESRSDKAVTGDSVLQKAIEACDSDASGVVPSFSIGEAAVKQLGSKRHRDADLAALKKKKKEEAKPDAKKSAGAGAKKEKDATASAPAAPQVKTLDTNSIFTHKHRIQEALDSDNVQALRKILIDLVDVRIDFGQLRQTKIGVDVGKVLRLKHMTSLYPLASALINKWAGELPGETKETLAAYHAEHKRLAAAGPAPSSTQLQSTQSMTAAGETRKFSEAILELLSRPEDLEAAHVTAEAARKVAQQIVETCKDADLRRRIHGHLSNPDHHTLRRRLLKRELSAQQLSTLPDAALRTDKEIAEEKERVAALIRLRDETEASMYVASEMFECPKCGAKKCVYHEQQTRSADEPTTKFVRCLACDERWTTE